MFDLQADILEQSCQVSVLSVVYLFVICEMPVYISGLPMCYMWCSCVYL